MPLDVQLGYPDIPTHTGFLLAEDEAIMRAFTGLTAQTPGDPMNIGVWWRWPEGETKIKYPFITLDLIGIAPDYKRWRSLYHVDPNNEVLFETPEGVRTPGSYIPDITANPLNWLEDKNARVVTDAVVVSGDNVVVSATAAFTDADAGAHFVIVGVVDAYIDTVTDETTVELTDTASASGTAQTAMISPVYEGVVMQPLIPMLLTYQVTHHARNALHDRYIASKFYTDVVIPRPFWIAVDADQTWRRCELVQMTPADTTETTDDGDKRIFRKIYTITMEAEVPQGAADAISKVLRVHADLYDKNTSQREPSDHAFDDVHDVALINWTNEPS